MVIRSTRRSRSVVRKPQVKLTPKVEEKKEIEIKGSSDSNTLNDNIDKKNEENEENKEEKKEEKTKFLKGAMKVVEFEKKEKVLLKIQMKKMKIIYTMMKQ